MKQERHYKSISEYDKNNNLVKYLELTDDLQHVKCYFNVNGDKLERTYLQDYRCDEDPTTETLNSIVQYENPIKLFNLTLDGETYIQPILSGNTSFVKPNVVNCLFSCKEENQFNASVDSFSINSNLIDDYLNKL
jgi:hypothetical protein